VAFIANFLRMELFEDSIGAISCKYGDEVRFVGQTSSHAFLAISAVYCVTCPKRGRGVANNYTLCIYENVSEFKYHVSVLFIQIFFICLSKNSLHLLYTWPITVPHGDN
jgi:hypothetical protein